MQTSVDAEEQQAIIQAQISAALSINERIEVAERLLDEALVNWSPIGILQAAEMVLGRDESVSRGYMQKTEAIVTMLRDGAERNGLEALCILAGIIQPEVVKKRDALVDPKREHTMRQRLAGVVEVEHRHTSKPRLPKRARSVQA